jgi:hypothetical protein
VGCPSHPPAKIVQDAHKVLEGKLLSLFSISLAQCTKGDDDSPRGMAFGGGEHGGYGCLWIVQM